MHRVSLDDSAQLPECFSAFYYPSTIRVGLRAIKAVYLAKLKL